MSMIQTRPLAATDLPAAHELSRAVGWPHRLEDWQLLLRLGAGLAAEMEGRLLGTSMWWPLGPAHVALGMVIVPPMHQGRGIGRRLMDASFAALGGRGILLNATRAGQPLYQRLGFTVTGAVEQFQGLVLPIAPPEAPAGERLRRIEGDEHDMVMELDRTATGLDRSGLLAALLDEAVEALMLERGGQAVGYALLRRFGRGFVLGPVVAPDDVAARALITTLLAACIGHFLRIDLVTPHDFGPWLEGIGLARAGGGVSMVHGDTPSQSTCRRFALISQALG